MEAEDYKIGSNIKGDPLTAENSKINWGKIKPLLKKVQDQTGSGHAAFYSVSDSSEGKYYYRTSPLDFSDPAVKAADGKVQTYFFESSASVNPDAPVQLLAAYIPDSRLAEQEMTDWILSRVRKNPTSNPSSASSKNEGDGDRTSETCWYTYVFYDSDGDVTAIQLEEDTCAVVTPDDGGGDPDDGENNGGGESGDGEMDVPCDQQLMPGPECDPDPSGGNPPYPPEPEPCNTDGEYPVLDNPGFQNIMQEAAVESGFEEAEDNRLEGFYVIKNQNGGYTKELIPNSGRTSCTYNISAPESFFDNAVALLHTHPYAPGDTVQNEACLEAQGEDSPMVYRFDGPSDFDIDVANAVSLDLYTIDFNNIHFTDKNDTMTGQADKINRCGY